MQGWTNDIAEVEQAFAQFISAFNAMDAERLGKCLSPQVSLFAPAGVPALISGASRVCAQFRSVFAAEPATGPDVRPVGLQITRLAPEAALVTFEFARAAASLGRRTFVYQLAQGQWLVVHIHASNT